MGGKSKTHQYLPPSLPPSLSPPLSHRVGEERAYWSLGNAYTCLGEHRQARHYAERHLTLATELGNVEGAAIAQKNLRDLDNALDLSNKSVYSSGKMKV